MGGVMVTQNPGLSEDLKLGFEEESRFNRRERRELLAGKRFQNDFDFSFSAFSAPSAVKFFEKWKTKNPPGLLGPSGRFLGDCVTVSVELSNAARTYNYNQTLITSFTKRAFPAAALIGVRLLPAAVEPPEDSRPAPSYGAHRPPNRRLFDGRSLARVAGCDGVFPPSRDRLQRRIYYRRGWGRVNGKFWMWAWLNRVPRFGRLRQTVSSTSRLMPKTRLAKSDKAVTRSWKRSWQSPVGISEGWFSGRGGLWVWREWWRFCGGGVHEAP